MSRVIKYDNDIVERASWLGVSPEVCESISVYDIRGNRIDTVISIDIDTGAAELSICNDSGIRIMDGNELAEFPVLVFVKFNTFELRGDRGWSRKFKI